jgi:hypothetical protein
VHVGSIFTKILLISFFIIPFLSKAQLLPGFIGEVPVSDTNIGMTASDIHNYCLYLSGNDDSLSKKKLKHISRWITYELPSLNRKIDGAIQFVNNPYIDVDGILVSQNFDLYDQNRCLSPGVDKSNWKQIGPNYPPKYGPNQTGGWISAVHVVGNDTNVILAGTVTSGLFRTVNNGVNWVNVTDNLPFPVLGIKNIKANPLNPNEIAAVTGTQYLPGNLIYSMNGGVTWARQIDVNVDFVDIDYNESTGELYAISNNSAFYFPSGITGAAINQGLPSGIPNMDQRELFKLAVIGDFIFVNVRKFDASTADIFKAKVNVSGGLNWFDNFNLKDELLPASLSPYAVFSDFSNAVGGSMMIQFSIVPPSGQGSDETQFYKTENFGEELRL